MVTITTVGVIVMAIKSGIAFLSVVGVASGANWVNKKTFNSKKGGRMHESDVDTERFNRRDLL